MAVTLEQAQILSSEFDLAEHEYQRALDVMRRSVELFYSCGLHMLATNKILSYLDSND